MASLRPVLVSAGLDGSKKLRVVAVTRADLGLLTASVCI